MVRGLLDNIDDSRLIELDLQKNRMKSNIMEPLVDLFEQNFKIRSLNLKNNIVTDDGAQLLLQTIGNNKFICKVNLDLNPVRHQILNDINKYTASNLTKVTEQEVPTMLREVIDIKKETA